MLFKYDALPHNEHGGLNGGTVILSMLSLMEIFLNILVTIQMIDGQFQLKKIMEKWCYL